MRTAAIRVWRTDEQGANGHFVDYEVPWAEGESVLGALVRIFETEDPGLAFRYGCRFRDCGLCGMRISGEDRLSCQILLDDGMEIKPLQHIPVVRDLVVDRRPFLDELRKFEITVDPATDLDLPAWKGSENSRRYYNTCECVECLACHSMCPHVGEDGHPGAYLLVKLSQMHYHPQNGRDRVEQARQAGLDHCRDCRLCYCPYGVKLQQYVIGEFLDGAGPTEPGN